MTGRELLAWMKPVERRLDTWEDWATFGDFKRSYNRVRKRRRHDRSYSFLERMYADMVQLGERDQLSLVAYINLWAAYTGQDVMPELYADVPDEALEPLR